MKKPKVLVVGSLVMDLTVSTERFPGAGETVLGRGFRMAPGGKGANQAIQAALMGAEVTMVGRVGNDEFGKILVDSCREHGIDTEHIALDPSVSSAVGNVQLEVNERETRNRIIVVPGANMTVAADDVEFLRDSIGQYDIVILQLEIPMEINERVAGYAFEKGVPVMLNPAPSARLSGELLSHVTYLSPNKHEASDLTGIRIRKNEKQADMADTEAVADALLAQGVSNVILTLGNAGAVAANRQGSVYAPCVDVVAVKDPTAAGDSFIGAFSVAVCAGLELGQALDFASYAATLTVSRMGAQPSLPTLDEVLKFMKEQGYAGFDLSLLDVLKQGVIFHDVRAK